MDKNEASASAAHPDIEVPDPSITSTSSAPYHVSLSMRLWRCFQNLKSKSGITTITTSIDLMDISSLAFFISAGGPFGVEQTLAAGPPLIVLLVFILMPIIYALPVSLTTAELISAIPNSTEHSWVESAFLEMAGEFPTYQVTSWLLFNTIFDAALYPKLFAAYFSRFFESVLPASWDYVVSAVVTLICLLLNCFFGIAIHSAETKMAFAAGMLSMFPFLILFLLSLPWQHPSSWILQSAGNNELNSSNVQWGVILSTVIWCYSGFESLNSLALSAAQQNRGDHQQSINTSSVQQQANQSKNWAYVKTVVQVLAMTTALYVLPLATSIGVDDPNRLPKWQEGEFAAIAEHHLPLGGGKWLAFLVVACSLVGLLSICLHYFPSTTSLLTHMNKKNWLIPKSTSGVNPQQIYQQEKRDLLISTIICTIVFPLLLLLDYNTLLQVDMLFYSLIVLAESFALIRVRSKFAKPLPALDSAESALSHSTSSISSHHHLQNMSSPFEIPLNNVGVYLLQIPPIGISLWCIVSVSTYTMAICGGLILANILSYLTFLRRRHSAPSADSTLAHASMPSSVFGNGFAEDNSSSASLPSRYALLSNLDDNDFD